MNEKKEQDWLEIPVFIHGIIPNVIPASHDRDYNTLLNLINTFLTRLNKPPLTNPIKVEWG